MWYDNFSFVDMDDLCMSMLYSSYNNSWTIHDKHNTWIEDSRCIHVTNFNAFFYVVCYRGEVRLSGGSTVAEGIVELCLWNQWSYICSDDWSANDAKVVCRQLGFEHSKKNIYMPHFCIMLHCGWEEYWVNTLAIAMYFPMLIIMHCIVQNKYNETLP